MDIEELRERLGNMEAWVNKSEAWWLETPSLDVEKMARLMVETSARLVTVTASRAREDEFRVIYHWDLQGRLLNFVTITNQATLPSITSICPAAGRRRRFRPERSYSRRPRCYGRSWCSRSAARSSMTAGPIS